MKRVLGNIKAWLIVYGLPWLSNPALAPVIFLLIVGGIHATTN